MQVKYFFFDASGRGDERNTLDNIMIKPEFPCRAKFESSNSRSEMSPQNCVTFIFTC